MVPLWGLWAFGAWRQSGGGGSTYTDRPIAHSIEPALLPIGSGIGVGGAGPDDATPLSGSGMGSSIAVASGTTAELFKLWSLFLLAFIPFAAVGMAFVEMGIGQRGSCAASQITVSHAMHGGGGIVPMWSRPDRHWH